ncbi:MAG: FliG C-terminal domain-containing protein [Planctomycetota bacterium]
MALTGKQKAAMLLMSLDAATAAELLKGVDDDVVQELAVELASLDAAGYRSSKQSLKLARQFCNSLQTNEEFRLKGFLKEMLKSTVGQEKAGQIQSQIEDLLYKRDPFISIRSVDSQTIASVLENEHPQAAAVVLSELPAEKNSEVLGLLDGSIRFSVVGRMTSCETMTAEAKTRIAKIVCTRLEAITRGQQTRKIAFWGSPTSGADEALPTRSEQSLRKVAMVLRNLGKDIRDGLLGAIQGKDSQAGEMVANLMIVWEDIPQVADGSLREALRGIDARRLALALVKADDGVVQKIKSNISEQAAATLDEKASLVSVAKKKDVEEARGRIVQVLREMNEKDELAFIEG